MEYPLGEVNFSYSTDRASDTIEYARSGVRVARLQRKPD
jgi:hypothetical protein